MLKGKELIAFIKANPGLGKAELARGAGYVRITEDGKEQLLITAFYDASMAAHGTPIKSKGMGKNPQYQTTVHASGILLVGKNYIKEFDAAPGDIFGIELRDDGIWLPLLEESAAPTSPYAEEPAPKAKARFEVELDDEDDMAVFDEDDEDEV